MINELKNFEMIKPKIAVTYNKNVGGPVLSLRKVVADSDAILIDCDYRKLVVQSPELEEIYNSPEKMQEIFKKAKQNAKLFLTNIDGLILSGNPSMVDPRLFGQHIKEKNIDLARSITELALIHIALQRGMPILGICGGLQILNVYLEGTIKSLNQTDLLNQGFDRYKTIRVDSNSELAKIMNPAMKNSSKDTLVETFTSHVRAIAKLGGKKRILNQNNFIKIVARAEDSCGNIEAIETQYGAPLIATQFHPEVAVKGLESAKLPKNISGEIYKAEDKEILLENKRIIDALITSAKAFHNKKKLNILNTHNDEFLKPSITQNNEHLSFFEKDNKVSTPPQKPSPEISKLIKNNISDQFIQNRIKELEIENNRVPTEDTKVCNISLHSIFNQIPIGSTPDLEVEERLTFGKS